MIQEKKVKESEYFEMNPTPLTDRGEEKVLKK
jgi:hypothetical protein